MNAVPAKATTAAASTKRFICQNTLEYVSGATVSVSVDPLTDVYNNDGLKLIQAYITRTRGICLSLLIPSFRLLALPSNRG